MSYLLLGAYRSSMQNAEQAGADQFVASVRERYARFSESARTITTFVDDAGKSLGKLTGEFNDLARKLREAETDDIVENNAENDGELNSQASVAVNLADHLTDDQLDLISKIVQEHGARLGRYPGMLFEMAFIYFVAAFEAYMQDVTELTLRHRPEILKSGKQLTVERIVELVQTDRLVEFLAEREVAELGYRSFGDQAEYYRDKFKLELGATAEIEHLIEIHARRNLLVHNGAFVNARYIETVVGTSAVIGQQLRISAEYWAEAVEALSNVATHVRDHTIRKYGRRPVR